MMKQKDIAIQLREQFSTISQIKKKKRGISLSLSRKLKDILGGDLDDYLGKKGKSAIQILEAACKAISGEAAA